MNYSTFFAYLLKKMSEEPVCKKARIDKSIANTCRLIECLPEPLNTNQFVAALLDKFFDLIVMVIDNNDHGVSLYTLIESLFKYSNYLYSEQSETAKTIYGIMSIEKFTNLVQSPLLFFNNIGDFQDYYELQDNYVEVMLRFFETFILLEFIGFIYKFEGKFRSFENDHYFSFVNRFCESVCENNDNMWFYVQQAHDVSDTMSKVFAEMFVSGMKQATLLNEVQYNIFYQDDEDVHPRIKNALHFCL